MQGVHPSGPIRTSIHSLHTLGGNTYHEGPGRGRDLWEVRRGCQGPMQRSATEPLGPGVSGAQGWLSLGDQLEAHWAASLPPAGAQVSPCSHVLSPPALTPPTQAGHGTHPGGPEGGGDAWRIPWTEEPGGLQSMKGNGASWLPLPLPDSQTVFKNRSASESHLVRKVMENNDNLLDEY